MPLLHVRRHQMRIQGKQKRSIRINQRVRWKSARHRRNVGSQAAILHRRICGGLPARIHEMLNGEERRIESHTWLRVWSRLASAVENSISRSDHELVCCLVSESNARSEVVLIGRNQ